jgi:hypothetical protein
VHPRPALLGIVLIGSLLACGGDDSNVIVDTEPVQVGVSRFGTSFGMCVGVCERTITIDGTMVSFVGVDRDGPTFESVGELTAAGIEAFLTATDRLDVSALEATYGCPDCADGGATHATVGDVAVTYEYANAPEVLRSLDQAGAEILGAMAACESGPLVTVAEGCDPTPA